MKQFLNLPDVFPPKSDGLQYVKVETSLEDKIKSRIKEICQKNCKLEYVLYNAVLRTFLGKCTGSKEVSILIFENASYTNFPISTLSVDYENTFKTCLKNELNELENIFSNKEKRETQELYEKSTFFSIYYTKMHYKFDKNKYIKSLDLSKRNLCLLNMEENKIIVEYWGNGIDRLSIENFLNGYAFFLEQVIEKSDSKLESLELVAEKTAKKMLAQSNNNFPFVNNHILNLLEKECKKSKDRIAVICGNTSITYGELWKSSKCVARELKKNNIQKDDNIGIYMPRSIDMVVAIIATLMVGATYIPIDMQQPDSKIRYILKETKMKICLVKEENAYMNKISVKKVIANKCNEELCEPLEYGKYVYTIFTSGTTGVPKGVRISSDNLINYISWRNKLYRYNESSITLQLISFSFDGFAANLYSSLLSGGRLVMIPESKRIDYRYITQVIKNEKVNITSIVPSMLSYLINADSQVIEQFNTIILAAEKATKSLINNIRNINKNIMLVNEYGPTECTIGILANTDLQQENISCVGKPAYNNKVCIVNREGHLVPPGMKGEISCVGRNVSDGYINITDNKSFKNINNKYINGKMYFTGDYGYLDSNGNINLIGRKDNQIKINGIRIEIDEIEKALLEINDINEVKIVIQKNENNEINLIAYYTSLREYSPKEFYSILKDKLNTSVIPSSFIFLKDFPRTINGKINIEELPNSMNKLDTEKMNPREKLVYEKYLETSKDYIGLDDNLFEYGYTSIKVIKLVEKLRSYANISPQDIYEQKTIRKIANSIKWKNVSIEKRLFDSFLETAIYSPYLCKHVSSSNDIGKVVNYQNILLLGGTGYLGTHILNELLKSSCSNVFLICREKGCHEVINRIENNMMFYFGKLLSDEDKKRIYCFKGDLVNKYFGLLPKEYYELSESIDCIINAAANVKHFGTEKDYLVNDSGNEELLKFCMIGKKKDYNLVSTLSIAGGRINGKEEICFNESLTDVGQKLDNLYLESKLSAEIQAIKLRDRININIFRVGNLVFDSKSGIFQKNIQSNAFYSIIRDLYKLGYFPEIETDIWNFTYVDQAAKAIIMLYNKENLLNKTFHIINNHIVNPMKISKLLNLPTLEIRDFIINLTRDLKDNDKSFYVNDFMIHSGLVSGNSEETRFVIDFSKTMGYLETMNFEWEKVDEMHVKKMMEYCKKVQFI